MATKTYYEPKEEAVPWLVGIDMQKFICGYGANFIGSSYVSCVGIGCQLQWGKILGDTVNLKIINFPVSFNECFGGLALFNGDPVAAAEYATITDITNTNFKIYMYANNAGTGYANANIFYLFLGAQQQWGFTNNTGRPYITFPFKFSNVFTAISCICHNGSPSEANTVYNVSISGMNIGASGGGSGKYWCAFGVAQQQWGASGYAVTFPIAFNVVYNVLSIPQTTASTSNAYWGRFYITALTKNGFNVSDTGAGSNRWIAIGSAQPQWGYSTVGSGAWALKFNGVYTAVVVGAPGFPAREFCGFTFDYTLTGWSFTAGYNSPVSYIRPTTTAISLGY